MANEQVIAKLQALKGEPGLQMHWQDQIEAIIADLSMPPPVPVSPPLPPPVKVEEEEVDKKSPKTAHAAHTSPAKTKGK